MNAERSNPPLATALQVEEEGAGVFVAPPSGVEMERLYGGQLIAQCILAASETIQSSSGQSKMPISSLHSYFLRPGDPHLPLRIVIENTRDGRSFSNRRVTVSQAGREIFSMMAAFKRPNEKLNYQVEPMDLPNPEELPTYADICGGTICDPAFAPDIDVRCVQNFDLLRNTEIRPPKIQYWMRLASEINDDPGMHAAILGFMSDYFTMDVCFLPHGLNSSMDRIMGVSLDHTMWFHRPFCVNEWVFFELESPSSSDERGLNFGRVFDRSGRLIASIAQEGLIRLTDASR